MTDSSDVLAPAADVLRRAWPALPRAGIVLGSGLSGLADLLTVEAAFDFRELPGLPASTAPGHRGRLLCGTLAGVPVILQDGRLHFYEGHSAAEIVRPVRLMLKLGIELLVVSNAGGGVNPDYQPGDVMLLDDHINLMGCNPLIGPNDDTTGPRFPDLSRPYDPALLDAAGDAARRDGWEPRRGVYLALPGPNYETSAEYRMARQFGADVVGMSTVPEVLVACHAGIRTLAFSIVSNVYRPGSAGAAGTSAVTTGDDVLATVAAVAPCVARMVCAVLCREFPPEAGL